jgi:Transposase DDE domain/Domain of unknown function (DUF4372)
VKTKLNIQPNRRHVSVLRQICQLIPNHLVPKLARETGADDKARTFTPWSHVVAMVYAQISHALSLNDVCDALKLHLTPLLGIRAAKPPAKNTLSHANQVRDCEMAKKLFWAQLAHLQSNFSGFVRGRGNRKFGWRFKRAINAVDSTTIQLVANCMDWAKHRRRKAAAKCHLRLDLQSFLPKFAIVDTAREHDNKRAREVCAGLSEGEIVIFDKAYLDFAHLWDLAQRGVFWVSRAKDNLACRVKKRLPRSSDRRILKDELIVLKGHMARQNNPGMMRRVTALVEVDGKERVMVFLTNNTEWAASSVVDLYGCRWEIETFFKELKQTVQLVDFLGHSANAVKWQVWTALLVHLLLRFLAWQSRWAHSFSRLVTYIRAALWFDRDIYELLKRCGTADGDFRCLGSPEQTWLPGFVRDAVGQRG